MCSRLLQWCNSRRRYIAYFCLIFNAYNEMCARFGLPIAMLGGMVKKNCSDTADTGTHCWSEETQAFVLGAYFYGHALQFVTIFIARRFTGFTATYRFWLTISIIIQLLYPTMADYSTGLLIASQAFRGLVAAIMVTHNFDFISRFSVGREGKVLISLQGAIHYIGQGTGGAIAGLMCENLGWKYYFYWQGACYILGLVLVLVFVPDVLYTAWYLTDEEKNLIIKDNDTTTKPEDSTEDAEDTKSSSSIKSIICRLYLVAFCFYMHAYNMVYYNILNVVPFFLEKILKADPLTISFLNVSLAILIAFVTLAFSYLFQKMDRMLTWIDCRMIFTLVPMVLQIVFLIGLSKITTIESGIVILTLSAIAGSTLFSGSIYTINYEIDPKNSPVLIGVYNSFGQVAGFIGPIMMAAITTTDPNTPDYESVYRERWGYFFYSVAGVAASGFLAILGAYLVKPGEWVNRAKKV